jgi:hypothetical protein
MSSDWASFALVVARASDPTDRGSDYRQRGLPSIGCRSGGAARAFPGADPIVFTMILVFAHRLG